MSKKLVKEFEQYYYLQDSGDGSANCILIPDAKFGEKMEKAELENGYSCYCDNVSSFTVRVYDDFSVEFPEVMTEEELEEFINE